MNTFSQNNDAVTQKEGKLDTDSRREFDDTWRAKGEVTLEPLVLPASEEKKMVMINFWEDSKSIF